MVVVIDIMGNSDESEQPKPLVAADEAHDDGRPRPAAPERWDDVPMPQLQVVIAS